jgi:REP element-mobilizing transposase RayT
MNHLFKNKYRTTTTRLQTWDYGWDGSYFITICTENTHHFFGEIDSSGTINLNDAGNTAYSIWELIPEKFPYAQLGEFIVMPNHIHGIITINKRYMKDEVKLVNNSKTGGKTGSKNPMLHENISRIVRWYKGRTAFEIRKSSFLNFKWQTGFYDTIVRSLDAYTNISNYIVDNPKKWIEKVLN